MDAIVDALAEQNAELGAYLDGRSEDEAHRPSACAGWTVSDVVLHLAQTNEFALASVEHRFPEATGEFGQLANNETDNVDVVAEWSVAQERDQPWEKVHERWQQSVASLQDAFRAADPSARVQWVAGDMAARTLATTRLAETWIHTGDVAGAFGATEAPTDRLRHIARLAWRTLPYAFARADRELAGPVSFELVGPAGDRWDFVPEAAPFTVVRGDAHELCMVAARRVAPENTALKGDGPDAKAVLELVRTYA